MNTMLNASTSTTSGANATCDQKLWKWQELRAWGTKKARIASSVAKLNGKLKADIVDAHAKISILTVVINQVSASKVGNLASTNCYQHEQKWWTDADDDDNDDLYLRAPWEQLSRASVFFNAPCLEKFSISTTPSSSQIAARGENSVCSRNDEAPIHSHDLCGIVEGDWRTLPFLAWGKIQQRFTLERIISSPSLSAPRSKPRFSEEYEEWSKRFDMKVKESFGYEQNTEHSDSCGNHMVAKSSAQRKKRGNRK